MSAVLKSPYPYFGGKSAIAAEVWKRLGDVDSYVEPFFGSGAVLLARPDGHKRMNEVINDKDGFVSNFWRAVSADAQAVARYADYPQFENDLHARHAWLVTQAADLTAKLEGDPLYYDARIAGWWAWGMALWIGSGFCSGAGSWQSVDGKLVKADSGRGVRRKLLRASDSGQGVRRRLLRATGVQGVQRSSLNDGLYAYFGALQARFQRVRVMSGDWMRVMSPAVLTVGGVIKTTGIFLDPPYAHEGRELVYNHDGVSIFEECRAWAVENGTNAAYRIALCGYDFDMPDGWTALKWKANGGYSVQRKEKTQAKHSVNDNREREVIWFSPACLQPDRQLSLFTLEDGAL